MRTGGSPSISANNDAFAKIERTCDLQSDVLLLSSANEGFSQLVKVHQDRARVPFRVFGLQNTVPAKVRRMRVAQAL